ncbi:Werner Syndrome-like exonuclease [Platanthera guangdongensis]|uniref:3'-5' exonuclease n=1 Tax=Platanthera guangdongensis TaxID=2320717 RepID=A0ABR2LYX0_9ASPA
MDSSDCYVMHIIHSGVPPILKSLLEDPSSSKVGIGIGGDATKISRDYNVCVTPLVDLSKYANLKLGGAPKNWGLSSLTEALTCKELLKPYKIRLGNWEANELSKEQLHYAATDAFASWYLYQQHVILEACKELSFYWLHCPEDRLFLHGYLHLDGSVRLRLISLVKERLYHLKELCAPEKSDPVASVWHPGGPMSRHTRAHARVCFRDFFYRESARAGYIGVSLDFFPHPERRESARSASESAGDYTVLTRSGASGRRRDGVLERAWRRRRRNGGDRSSFCV